MSVAEKHSVKGTRENIFNSARVRHLVGLRLYRNRYIYLMILPVVVYFILLKYVPMWFLRSAFYDYKLLKGFDSKFVGWKNFERLLSNPNLMNYIGNTLKLNLTALVILFPMPMFFALMLNELRSAKFMKFVQTISYLPHFISLVVVCGMVKELLSTTGPINMLISSLGFEKIQFMSEPAWFDTVYIGSGIWQALGWGTILYLTAMTNIDMGLYEAAEIDGANRLQQIWNITIPAIMNTILVVFILNLAKVMNVFESVFVL